MTGQYAGAIESRLFITRAWFASILVAAAKKRGRGPNALMTAQKLSMANHYTMLRFQSTQHVTTLPLQCVTSLSETGVLFMPRDEERRRNQGRRLAEARAAAGFRSARAAALGNGWNEGTYRTHESGTRTIGLDDAERYARRYRAAGIRVSAQDILFGDESDAPETVGARQIIPVMGYVGAGGDVDPDHEQVPFDGLEQIELPGPLGMLDDPIGFVVRGDSQLPRYSDGDTVIVEREQPWAIESMIGDVAVVRTDQSRRYIKKIMPGSKRHHYDLVGLNGPTIEDARIQWASPVRIIIPNVGVRRTRRTPAAAQTSHRAGKVRG
jgi:phage repressor protein C with HTH and peptisase S24 domain